MRNPFKILSEFFFLPEEIDTHNIYQVIKDAPRFNYQTKCMITLIVGLCVSNAIYFSLALSANSELDSWKGKHRQDSLQEIHMKQRRTFKRQCMNREILFRGKRVDNGEWIIGSLTEDLGRGVAIMSSPFYSTYILDEDDNFNLEEDGRAIGGFFGGLKDKAGKEMFEGDIVKHMGHFLHEVKFKQGAYGYDGSMHDDFIAYSSNLYNLGMNDIGELTKVEIIGTIHDNPELLK